MGQKVFAAAIAALALGASAAPASADQAILGVATPTTVGGGISCSTSCTIVQTALPVGEIVTPPATGRIVAWWALGDTQGRTRRPRACG